MALVVSGTAVFTYAQTVGHLTFMMTHRQPSFHAIYQFKEHQLRLMHAVGEFVHAQQPASRTAILDRLEVLSNRAGVMISPETEPWIDDLSHARLLVGRVNLLLEEIAPLARSLQPGDREAAGAIMSRLVAMQGPYEALRRTLREYVDRRNEALVAEARLFGYSQLIPLAVSLIAGGVLCVLIFKQMRRVELLASHDDLTKLLNRSQLIPALRRASCVAAASGRMVALHCIDIDRFRSINDTLGHAVGDQLLIEFGRRLCAALAPEDTILRLSGDEFAIVQDRITDIDEAKAVAECLVRLGDAPFEAGDHHLTIGVSVGCALLPANVKDVTGLVEKADLALNEAKRMGRRTYSFFRPQLERHASRQRYLENELTRALAEGDLEVYFQPKFRLVAGNVVGAEALVRWAHPEVGAISPVEFIPIAEESGLIVPLGSMVLETACREAAAWQELSPYPVHVSVNLSPVQFERQNIEVVIKTALKAANLDAACLDVEITENLLLKSCDEVRQQLDALRATGASISLDDFGTGYSSIGYLRRFRFDRIKIDKSFVEHLGATAEASSLVDAMIRLAHGFGMKVVAEGVETEAQMRALARMGCDEAQGFYLGRPLPAAAFRQLIGVSWHRAGPGRFPGRLEAG